MNLSQIPNAITALRVLLIIPFAYSLLSDHMLAAFYYFFVATFSDGLDGFLARRFGWQTRLGSWLDPVADKSLMLTSYVLLGWKGLLPLWLVVVVVARDAIILAGVALVWFIHRRIHFVPFKISKLNTALQLLLVLMVLFSQAFSTLPEAWLQAVMVLMCLSSFLSVCAYVWEGSMTVLGYREPVR